MPKIFALRNSLLEVQQSLEEDGHLHAAKGGRHHHQQQRDQEADGPRKDQISLAFPSLFEDRPTSKEDTELFVDQRKEEEELGSPLVEVEAADVTEVFEAEEKRRSEGKGRRRRKKISVPCFSR